MSAYLDASAIVKLVVQERESGALQDTLSGSSHLASSQLSRVEVVRAVKPQGEEAVRRARDVLDGLTLVAADVHLLDRAAELSPEALRSLDAVHLASALSLEDELEALITYDRRMLAGARELDLTALAPG